MTARPGAARHAPSERASRHLFIGVSGALLAASVAATVVWCASMASMGGMPMPGGWTLSMTWMRMAGQSWTGATAAFLGMWTVMMVAMMLPAALPTLWRHRRRVADAGGTRPGVLTALVGAGYLLVWAGVGAAVFPLGVTLAALAMAHPAVAGAAPVAAAAVVVIAGVLQRTAWKARALARCGQAPPARGAPRPATAGTAWRDGVHLGLRCARSCATWTAVLLVLGVMDLRTMAVVAVAITGERLVPDGARVARVTGAVAIGAGLLLLARAATP